MVRCGSRLQKITKNCIFYCNDKVHAFVNKNPEIIIVYNGNKENGTLLVGPLKLYASQKKRCGTE